MYAFIANNRALLALFWAAVCATVAGIRFILSGKEVSTQIVSYQLAQDNDTKAPLQGPHSKSRHCTEKLVKFLSASLFLSYFTTAHLLPYFYYLFKLSWVVYCFLICWMTNLINTALLLDGCLTHFMNLFSCCDWYANTIEFIWVQLACLVECVLYWLLDLKLYWTNSKSGS